MKDLIEKLKKNEKPFGLFSNDEKKEWCKIGRCNCQIYGITGWKDGALNGQFYNDKTYRISPDYKTEKECIETRTEITVGGVRAWHPHNKTYYGLEVGRIVAGYQLIGFKFAEQTVSDVYSFPAGYKRDVTAPNPYGVTEVIIEPNGQPKNLVLADRAVWMEV